MYEVRVYSYGHIILDKKFDKLADAVDLYCYHYYNSDNQAARLYINGRQLKIYEVDDLIANNDLEYIRVKYSISLKKNYIRWGKQALD